MGSRRRGVLALSSVVEWQVGVEVVDLQALRRLPQEALDLAEHWSLPIFLQTLENVLPREHQACKVSDLRKYYFCHINLILQHLLHPLQLLGNDFWGSEGRIGQNKLNLHPRRKSQGWGSVLFPAEERQELCQSSDYLLSSHLSHWKSVLVWHWTARLEPPVEPGTRYSTWRKVIDNTWTSTLDLAQVQWQVHPKF